MIQKSGKGQKKKSQKQNLKKPQKKKTYDFLEIKRKIKRLGILLKTCKSLQKELRPYLKESAVNKILDYITNSAYCNYWIDHIHSSYVTRLNLMNIGDYYFRTKNSNIKIYCKYDDLVIKIIPEHNIKYILDKYHMILSFHEVIYLTHEHHNTEKRINSIYSKLSSKDKILLINKISNSNFVNLNKLTNKELKAALLLS